MPGTECCIEVTRRFIAALSGSGDTPVTFQTFPENDRSKSKTLRIHFTFYGAVAIMSLWRV